MEKTLYISDLDGTLLNARQRISAFTANTINTLVRHGVLFSYATARSFFTASKTAQNITVNIPVIVYNGAFILDHATGNRLYSNFFDRLSTYQILVTFHMYQVSPIVYALQNGIERFSYLPAQIGEAAKEFLLTRKGDVRNHPVSRPAELADGEVFYFTCIDEEEKLYPIYSFFHEMYSCVYQRELYSGQHWLEIMPSQTNKANAVLKLKELMGCQRVVSFGDGVNDIPMFRLSQECYAVSNADERLRKIATAVIASNLEDGVAQWLLQNAQSAER